MAQTNHWAVFLSNNANKHSFVHQLINGKANGHFEVFNLLKGVLFSSITLNEFIEEEARHEEWVVSKQYNRGIRNLSSGEQKKVLLSYLLAQNPDFIILDNPFDNLDITGQASLLKQISELSETVSVIQLINRNRDLMPFINNAVRIEEERILDIDDIETYLANHKTDSLLLDNKTVPTPI